MSSHRASDDEDLSLYDILGLTRTCSEDDVRKAYRRLALQMHPDRNLGNEEESRQVFMLVGEAYEVLSDPERRAVYDRFGREGLAAHDQGHRHPASAPPSPAAPAGDAFHAGGDGNFSYHDDADFGFRHAQSIFDAFFAQESDWNFGGFGGARGRGGGGGGVAGAFFGHGVFNHPFFHGGGSGMYQQQGGFDPFGPFAGMPGMGGRGGGYQQQFQSSSNGGGVYLTTNSNGGGTSSSSSTYAVGGGGGGVVSSSSSMSSGGMGGGVRRSVRTATTVGAGGRSRTRTETTTTYPDGRSETTVEEWEEDVPRAEGEGHYMQQVQHQRGTRTQGWTR